MRKLAAALILAAAILAAPAANAHAPTSKIVLPTSPPTGSTTSSTVFSTSGTAAPSPGATPNVFEASVWYGEVFAPVCAGGVAWLAECDGSGWWLTFTGNAAWNQLVVCSQQLVSGGWQNLGCADYPPGEPDDTTSNSGTSPAFKINRCNRWYTAYAEGFVLLQGGWQRAWGRAPGIEVRC